RLDHGRALPARVRGRRAVDPLRHRGSGLERAGQGRGSEGSDGARGAHVRALRGSARGMTEQAAPRTILSLPGFAFRGSRLFPGVYAWATTVASPAFARDASVLTRLAAVAALLGLFAGVYWLGRVPRLGRVLGIHGFIGLAMATWVSARHDGIQL